ncbi:MAG: hypothetical protein JXQ65_13830 [Candidatus Marinimicrobia bacterium]|nr:hypothetical protein [Candidatus Neomarinimicrobiota bacterium]
MKKKLSFLILLILVLSLSGLYGYEIAQPDDTITFQDFGDAPDPTYPTLLTSNGAYHSIDSVTYLGSGVDPERDGQPTVGADGDDNGNTDDDDGVTFTSPWIMGQNATVAVVASVNGILYGWIDFNNDGDWADAGEMVFTHLSLAKGINNLTFSVPADAQPYETYARFRFSVKGTDSYLGDGGNGEVEDYKVKIQLPMDYGDLPDSYSTLQASNGASHILDYDVFLGSHIDIEGDGVPSSDADGDDNHDMDDEDGVTFPSLYRGQSCTLTVAASTKGLLYAWMDFDRSGDFSGAGEAVASGVSLSSGNNDVPITIPSDIQLGDIYCRFRFTSKEVSYVGIANDGEVEDYKVVIEEEPTLDFGDAPDHLDIPQSYPTTLKSDGARHLVNSKVYLGTKIDKELDGQPTISSNGDDNNDIDDEDGVTFDPLYVGESVNITVKASTKGILNAWIDYNQDGDWSDRKEHIFNSVSLNSGDNTLTFNIPPEAALGQTYSRFRFGYEKYDDYLGYAGDGEVEDYYIKIEEKPVYDFGDAPDQYYKTLLTSNGARHQYNPDVFLGSMIDIEEDGQPGDHADGDDLDGDGDDDDGIIFNDPIIPGDRISISINASTTGKLDAWIDFNRDGDWNDTGERIAQYAILSSGNNSLSVTVPANAVIGESYARFRFSTSGVPDYTGTTTNGEVEDYLINIVEEQDEMDFGDLPDAYSTTLGNNGARHVYNPDVFLGLKIDMELDGIPTSAANGDDLNNQDDEDGVNFTDLLFPGDTVSLSVKASTDGILNGWIDFNYNGQMNDVYEHVFINKTLTAGDHILWFTVPTHAINGSTYARFRFSLTGNEDPEGLSPDGEVEDYKINIYHYPDFDFGDAPAPYPTVTEPKTAVNNLLFMGPKIDAETAGQPHDHALGDDLNGEDDEDGATFTTSLVPGSNCAVTIDLSQSQPSSEPKLKMYIDLDHDGSWTEVEKLIDKSLASQQVHNLNFTLPATAMPGTTFVRFILSDEGPLPVWGEPKIGEIEDYEVVIEEEPVELDLGDAPNYDAAGNAAYPTLLAENGARHVHNPDVFLGLKIDIEPDGQPNLTATGDDFSNQADEDGVTFLNAIVPGTTANITVKASTSGILNAWCDFNRDLDWDDAGEQIFHATPLTGGNNNLSFIIPADAEIGDTYLRFRFSLNGIDQYTGEAPDGEVEDYKVTVEQEELDYGDAPDIDENGITAYPTLLTQDGARHVYNPDVFLGMKIDVETDGQPNLAANGDDIALQADEDGITFLNSILSGGIANIKVKASTSGILNAWMDFNRDLDWDDAGEHIFNNQPVSGGYNNLSFAVPVTNFVGETYCRFRFSLNGINQYKGKAPDGEVEDYKIKIDETTELLDFGDAPDTPTAASYLTLLASDGARHIYNADVFLGAQIDLESDGQPDALATGDDVNAKDDEDGVTFLAPIVPGTAVKIRVKASTRGILNAWMDFYGNGNWDDNGEHIFHTKALSPGDNYLTFSVPGDAQAGYSYSRFRFCLNGIKEYKGLATDGEVEDYFHEIVDMDLYDYGDAPDNIQSWNYPTLLSGNGARHLINPKVFLGTGIDLDSDGQPTLLSDGDNIDGNDDENGVAFVTPIISGAQAKVEILTSTRGKLNGWIDFNADGDWDDVGERIFINQTVGSGLQTLVYNVPPGLSANTSYSRFRFTLDQSVSYFGPANDGEVEDYKVEIKTYEQYDFGDAPDAPYPTLRTSNGAYHLVTPNLFLGDKVDADADGSPDVNAWGDDTFDGNDDEDGIVFTTSWVPGAVIGLKAKASTRGYLNAWIDFNGNGSWADANEHIFIDLLLGAGDNNLSFTAPLNVTPDLTYARFRFSDCKGLSFDGPAPSVTHVVTVPYGEVEDYKLQFEFGDMEWDFGDAPDSNYRTLLSYDGARHRIDPDIFLGTLIDPENDGQPDVNATGDDIIDGNDDEDGVKFLTPWIPGYDVKIDVIASTQGVLNTWIDWDHNKKFDSGTEHVFVNMILNPGINTLAFHVPSTVKPLPVYSRFRFTSYRGVLSYGAAKNGEVEDYIMKITEKEEKPDLDFGDAPDKPYPTLFSNRGAYHVIDPQLFFGSSVDPESDGQPNATASGDDMLDGSDDEDGIYFTGAIVPGISNAVTVIVSLDGIINAWIDFDGNGNWAGFMEQIFKDYPIPQGTNTLTFPAPAAIKNDTLYARFRLSQTSGIPFYGPAPEGEVEDLMVSVDHEVSEEWLDFGDAPDSPYPTLLSSDGARHGNGLRLFLGDIKDNENDGNPDINALGDDLSTSDDEDGIIFSNLFVTGHRSLVKFTSVGSGFINAWIDFNGNGSWSDPNEHVIQNVDSDNFLLSRGHNVGGLSFIVPDDAVTDPTYARFRISEEEGISFDGYSLAGEVEDYKICIYRENNDIDYGDAPDINCHTTKLNFGAGHFIDELYLGQSVDPDNDGQPSSDALGDDYGDGNDDEDGIQFPIHIYAGSETALIATASMIGYLNGWIDIDNDLFFGCFDHLIRNYPVSGGVNRIVFDVPANAVNDSVYSRFRITHEPYDYPTQVLLGGEVEDYRILLMEQPDTTHVVNINNGLNYLGLPFAPGGGNYHVDSFFDIFVEINSDGSESLGKSSHKDQNPIELLKNSFGDVYVPEYGINEIGEIEPAQGYLMLSDKTGEFHLDGKIIDPTTQIDLTIDENDQVIIQGRPSTQAPARRIEGLLPGDWMLLGYLPTAPIPIEEALEGILEKILAVKNNLGQLYVPDIGINEIGMMVPGQSYWISLNDTATFSFPSGPMSKGNAVQEDVHFSSVLYTGENTTIVVPAVINPVDEQGNTLSVGDEIAVFNTRGQCCGMEIWRGENIAITVWGDNEMTAAVDGLLSGDTLFFKLWDKSRHYELLATAEFEDPFAILYEPDKLIVLTSLTGTSVTQIDNEKVPDQFSVSLNYPNPFNPRTNIEFSLAHDAKVELFVYNILGHKIREVVNKKMNSGYYRVFWDGMDQSGHRVASGVYLYRILMEDQNSGEIYLNKTQKMLLIK